MLLKRFYHEGLAQASYLVGCERTGEAVIVDANRYLDQYVTAAAEQRMRITHVTETHIHADFLSGSRELAERVGAPLLLSSEGGSDWQYSFAADSGATLLRDGDRFMVGLVRLDVVHTPGHTPEHLIFVVTDTPASDRPVGALTGDFVFVGDVGRPDLLERAAGVEGAMRAGAKLLFESLRRFTEHYPDHMQIWPGHGAGSACGKSLGAVPQTTLGYEKLVNWAFQIDDDARFVEAVLDGQPDPPRYFATMKRMNREGPPPRPTAPIPTRDVDALAAALTRGDVVIDTRRTPEFGAGFIRGTINIPWNRGFVGYAGAVIPYDRDVMLLNSGDDDVGTTHAASELAMIGIDRVVGTFAHDVFNAWTASGRALSTLGQLSPAEVVREIQHHRATVLDVRESSEFNETRIPGSIHAPLGQLADRVRDRSRDEEIVLVCRTGSRSAIGGSVLAGLGFTSVANMRGGLTDWTRAGLPVERDLESVTPS